MNSYELSRNYFDWCFENPEKITPSHTAIYFFAIEHCNRLGWKEKFGLPSQMVMDAIGIKNWRTYIKSFNDLTEWGFFELVEKSKNQYSSNIIAIVKNTKATTKALDKALQKHSQKQSKSIDSINKPINNKQENNEHTAPHFLNTEIADQVTQLTVAQCRERYDKECQVQKESIGMNLRIKLDQLKPLQDSFDAKLKSKTSTKTFQDYTNHFANWVNKLPVDELKRIITPERELILPHMRKFDPSKYEKKC